MKNSDLADSILSQDPDLSPRLLAKRLEGLGEFYRYEEHYTDSKGVWQICRIPDTRKKHIYWSNLYRIKPDEVDEFSIFMPNHMASGDYCGSLVEASNRAVFLDKFDRFSGVFYTVSYFHSKSVAICIGSITDEMVEDFEALTKYPLLDDDHHTKLEMEQFENDMKSFIESDLKQGLLNKFEDDETCLDAIEDANMVKLYYALSEKANEYWFSETATHGYVDTEKLVKACEKADIMEAFQ